MKVNPSARNLVTNSAFGTSLENQVGVTGTATTTIIANIDLAVTKSQSSDTPSAGANLTYTIGVVNNGPSSATNVQLTDTLPVTVSLWTVTATQGSCQTGAPITCTLGTIAPLTGVTATVVVTVNDAITGTQISNVANVSAQETDTDQANNTDAVTATVYTVGDVSIVKTGSAVTVVAGTSMVYTLTASNNGPSLVTNVVITDDLPGGVTAISATLPYCGITGPQVTCIHWRR